MERVHRLENKRLTGAALKWIAIITMFIDHIGAFLLEPYLVNFTTNTAAVSGLSMLFSGMSYSALMQIYTTMRLIGRLAFPIFAFLIVEGFFHTRNLKKYIIQIGIFAIISEFAFDLAAFGVILETTHQNIYFTLLIGLLTIAAFEKFKTSYIKWLALLVGLIVSEYFRVDYASMGILVIFFFYYFYDSSMQRNIITGIILLQQATAVLSLFLIQQYNGKRGKQNKYFFYIFYPAHLLILYLIRSYYF